MAVAKAKKSKKGSTAKVVSQPKVDTVVEVPKKEVKGYLVPILFQREPIEKDIPVADVFYRRDANLIELECHAPNHEAEIEMCISGDISVSSSSGNVTMISKSTSPIQWVKNLHISNEFAGKPFIAKESQEIYES